MSIGMLLKKKKYRFLVDCTVEELTAVPYVNAILFAKLRLLEGGTFSEESPRLEVSDHSVRWHKTFSFQSKMTANAATGVLDACHCRVSIRREAQGGKSCHKLGFVDLNLASFAGQGATSQRFLLEGYRTNNRHAQDNSILRVTVNMTLLCGDPCFKTSNRTAAGEEESLHTGGGASSGKGGSQPPQDGGSPSPDSSPLQASKTLLAPPASDLDYSSLPRRQGNPDGCSSGGSSVETPPPSAQCPLLERLDSCLLAGGVNNAGCGTAACCESGAGLPAAECGCAVSVSGGCPAGQAGHLHQRQGSGDSGQHLRIHSSGSSHCDSASGSLKDRSKRSSHKNALNVVEERGNPKMDSTRVDPDVLINQLILSSKLSPSPVGVGGVVLCPSPSPLGGALSSGPDSGVGIEHESELEGGLRLVIGRDGVPALTAKDHH